MREIFERRSVRTFTPEAVTDEQVTQLIKAAMQAPSSFNQQPWEFVVLTETDSKLAVLDFHPHAIPVKTASRVIVICADLSRRKMENDCWVLDCSAAAQNMLLESVSLGLGAVWLGIYPYEDRIAGLSKQLGLPKHIVPLCGIAVGHAADDAAASDRFLPERIHQEKW